MLFLHEWINGSLNWTQFAQVGFALVMNVMAVLGGRYLGDAEGQEATTPTKQKTSLPREKNEKDNQSGSEKESES